NILDTTRQPDTRFDHVDLNRLLDDITILLLPETISKHIKIVKDFDESLPLVYGSKGRFEELFLNLIDNAIDACSQNGVISIITKTAGPPHYSLRTNDGPSRTPWAQVTVKDNGRGIPEAFLQDIFKPFYTTKARGQGTGIGLAISQEIVNSHHGFISVESMVDKGSAFTVLLPSTEKVNA
ncbi:MAG: HAMP domain-containing histidine kinase, partial [Deltaproteobacteria bacterium]|nr:HAMP domain-containing histidine kinase [Deltaproteobacteria bacterium]